MARSTLYVFAAVVGMTSLASAQSPVLAEFYGRGVHAYNAGDMLQAHQYLTMAIDNGSIFNFGGSFNTATFNSFIKSSICSGKRSA